MLLPAVQYGDWSDVKKRMRKIVTRIKRGESITDVMTEDGMLDVAKHSGMVVVGGLVHAGSTNFHCFVPWKPLVDALWEIRVIRDAALEAKIFDESLRVPWGVLGLLSHESQVWFLDETRFEPFLDAVIGAWDELDSIGPRYFTAVQGTTLWSIPNNLHYVLANLGVPHDLLRAPLPAEGPRGLLRYVKGTLIAEDVRDLGAHLRRLCDPDGYRPERCPRCGHDSEIDRRVIDLLTRAGRPFSRSQLRAELHVRNERLGDALARLVAAGAILRTADRWAVPVPTP